MQGLSNLPQANMKPDVDRAAGIILIAEQKKIQTAEACQQAYIVTVVID